MAEANVAPISNQVRLNQIMLSGRVAHKSKYEGNLYTVLVLPAVDAFSKPSTVKVKSTFPLGDVGEDVKLLASYNGWRADYTPPGGERIVKVEGFFVAVE